jgi:hypothetical protein
LFVNLSCNVKHKGENRKAVNRVGNLKFIIMKKKSFNKKLVLNKKSITNLNMINIKGGADTAYCTQLNCTFDNCDSRLDYSCMIPCRPK